jgi:hypothetical protein
MNNRPIHFEYQQVGTVTIVALDSKLSDYGFQPQEENGQIIMRTPERTIKDCRNIDGCVYFHLGHVTDTVMIDLIEKFQKLKQEKGWKQNPGIIVPDHKFKFN